MKVSSENYVFVDKTPFVEQLESLGEQYLFFLRPRKFGKSLFISMLEYYYDVKHADKFDRLFGDYYIGKYPTPLHNNYLTLVFDFSGINTETEETTLRGFLDNVQVGLKQFMGNYEDILGEADWSDALDALSPEIAMRNFLGVVKQRTDRKIYLLIDEYDHFANELLAFQIDMFKELVSRTGFVRKFYEVLKTGARDGVIDRMFITGITPITIDSFTSGFNLGTNLSLEEGFHNMLGFTEAETYELVEMVCSRIGCDTNDVYQQMTRYYNGYKFSKRIQNGKLFNPDMVLYYLRSWMRYRRPPDELIDTNIASDYKKVGNLVNLLETKEGREIVNELMSKDSILGNLTLQFNLERGFKRDDFLSLLLYMGFITVGRGMDEEYELQIPNYVVEELYYRYFYELMEREYALDLRVTDLRAAMRQLAYDGRVEKLIRIVENFLGKVLSNRDLRGFRESHLKVHILSLLHLSRLFYIQSEMEAQRGYIDIFLRETPQFPIAYEWVLELKYTPKERGVDWDQLKAEGEEQLERYMQKVRPQTRRSMKGALLIFSGEGECVFNQEIEMIQ
jgi:hypothetical protein